ncbi:geminin-like [Patiria miniata]|uniref:Geminin n=1 Tax=Patiria miniata TaxID=46514 RepID=A0A913ZYA3_PATMI|nr:geminin-like [Patiria miniata]XP_038056625.1 geminin-like [Patiria miniata]
MSEISARISMDGCMSTMNGGNKMFTPMPGGRTRKTIKAKSIRKSHQTTLGSSPVLCKGQRKTLQVIQPAVCSKTKLTETTNRPKAAKRKHNSDAVEKPSKMSKCERFPIYEDPKSSSESNTDIEKSKTAEEKAWELMVQEPAPESYWKDLAEERRVALDETLKENEQLHGVIAELKTENGRLKEMADQAEYLASVLQNVIDGKEIDQDSDASESEHESCTPSDKHGDGESERHPEEVSEANSDITDASSRETEAEGNSEN